MSEAVNHDDVLSQAADWRRAGKAVALATVVSTWGSSPRPVHNLESLADLAAVLGDLGTRRPVGATTIADHAA